MLLRDSFHNLYAFMSSFSLGSWYVGSFNDGHWIPGLQEKYIFVISIIKAVLHPNLFFQCFLAQQQDQCNQLFSQLYLQD